jgi:hypothetical protein
MRLGRARKPPTDPAAQPPADADRRGARLVPLVLTFLLAIATLGMVYFSFHANRRDALQLTDDTLGLLEERIVAEVSAFLSVPERALSILAEFAGNRAILPHERGAATESATALLRVAPMLALVGFADADGNWLMVRRDPDSGVFDSKTIATEGGVRRAFWTRQAGLDGVPVTEDDPDDRFDPRTRPWWRLSQTRPGVSWTDLYVFFTDRLPGVTAARALPDGPVAGAVMVDVRLSSLSAFLSRLTVGRTGRALVLDGDGRLVAVGDPSHSIAVEGDALQPARLYQMNDPVLSRAFDLFRAEGAGRRVVEVEGDRYIMLAARLPGEGRTWNLLMVVPQDDFIGFVRRNSLIVLAMALGVVVLGVLLAQYAIRQRLRASATRVALRREAAQRAAQADAFAELARAGSVPAILSVVGTVLGARRVGLWRLEEGGAFLLCESQFDVAAGTQASGIRLRRAEAAKTFAVIEAGGTIDVADAAADPRLGEIARLYLRPVGSRALLSVPVVGAPGPAGGAGAILGALWVEDAAADSDGRTAFARTAAALLASSIAPPASRQPAPPAAAVAPAGSTRADTQGTGRARGQALIARMRERMEEAAGPDSEAQFFPRLAVLSLVFADDAGVTSATCADGTSLIARIRRSVLAAAGAARVSCVRVLGERVLFADGFDGDADAALRRLVDVALALQDRLTDSFTEAQLGLDFRMGVDLGPAAGGRDAQIGGGAAGPDSEWNVFGEAVRAAALLADTAPPGAIQVSDTAQAALAAEFLLRARGRFFIPETGEIGTWLVAGHV